MAALRILLSSKRGDEVSGRGFLAAYFTSLLGPGTLDHADFLRPGGDRFSDGLSLVMASSGGVNPRGDALPVGNPLGGDASFRDLTIP